MQALLGSSVVVMGAEDPGGGGCLSPGGAWLVAGVFLRGQYTFKPKRVCDKANHAMQPPYIYILTNCSRWSGGSARIEYVPHTTQAVVLG